MSAAPIDMVLHCPRCGMQHIDAPDTDEQYTAALHESSWWELGGDKPERWTNPPHRSHKCHGCGHIWRPADVATNGVAAVKTTGKADSPIAEQRTGGVFSAERTLALANDASGLATYKERERCLGIVLHAPYKLQKGEESDDEWSNVTMSAKAMAFDITMAIRQP